MALTKVQKKEILDELGAIVKDSLSLVFVNFHGLGANETVELRKALSAGGVGYTVAKKTLVKKALGETTGAIAGEIPELPGELALAYGNDQIAPAREVFQFQKKFDGKIAILGGVFEKVFIGREKMLAIATIPSRKTLEAQFVNLINSPIQRLAVALSEIAKTRGVQ